MVLLTFSLLVSGTLPLNNHHRVDKSVNLQSTAGFDGPGSGPVNQNGGHDLCLIIVMSQLNLL